MKVRVSAGKGLFATSGNVDGTDNLISCSAVEEEMLGGVLGPVTSGAGREARGELAEVVHVALMQSRKLFPRDRDSSLERSRMNWARMYGMQLSM